MRPGVKFSRAADAASSNACTPDTGSESDPSATRVMISPMSAARRAGSIAALTLLPQNPFTAICRKMMSPDESSIVGDAIAPKTTSVPFSARSDSTSPLAAPPTESTPATIGRC